MTHIAYRADTLSGAGEAVPVRILPHERGDTPHWHASHVEFVRPAYVESKAGTQRVVGSATKEREFAPMSFC